jgi:cysteine desulfurase
VINKPVYLDYAATTPIAAEVVAKMLEFMGVQGKFANASAFHHQPGKIAAAAVALAREQVAELIGAGANEIVWTSGATEAVNLALKGATQLYQGKGKHIVTFKTEHKAVLDSCQHLEKNGFSVTYLSPLADGTINMPEFIATLRDDTCMVSVMHINNETGVIADLDALAEQTAARGILLHVDAAQSAGKLALNVQRTPIDLMSLSAHKIYGPKGVGALYLRRKPRVRVAPLVHGGGQESGMRSGTLPTHQIAGMGEAYRIARMSMHSDSQHTESLRKHFLAGLSDVSEMIVNGAPIKTNSGILNICFKGHMANVLMQALPDLAIATGSACINASTEPSYVLRAMGLTMEMAQSALRFSFGRFTTRDEIDFATQALKKQL